MNRRYIGIFAGFAVVTALAMAISYHSCKQERKYKEKVKQVHLTTMRQKISYYTDGTIGRDSEIYVAFYRDVPPLSKVGVKLKDNPFNFNPPIKGVAKWASRRKLVFYPKELLKYDTKYKARLNLESIGVKDIESKYFDFSFYVEPIYFSVNVNGLQPVKGSEDKYTVWGYVSTTSLATLDEIKNVLSIKEDKGRELPIDWKGKRGRKFEFTAGPVKRRREAFNILVSWDGKDLGVDIKGSHKVTVPPAGVFSVTSAKSFTKGERYVEIQFDDEVDGKQDLTGFITVEPKCDGLKFNVRGRVVRLFCKSGWKPGKYTIKVFKGIKSTAGKHIKKDRLFNISFNPLIPAVEFATKGVIIPASSGGKVIVPVKLRKLKAVSIEAFAIKKSNLLQFMQVNSLDGNFQVRRVEKLIWSKRIKLDEKLTSQDRWGRYGLDITPLVKKFPGGMVRLKLKFERKDIIYPCNNIESRDQYSRYYYRDYDNPCSKYFYTTYGRSRFPERNVMVSNLGLIAKRGKDSSLFVAVVDIRTAKPVRSALVELYDYQQYKIAAKTTGSSGIVRFRFKEDNKDVPYFIIASNGKYRTYLKLDSSMLLSMTTFDTGGSAEQKGIQGFIYGERGVWRPGDTMHISLMLFNREGKLPAGHPIKFEVKNSRSKIIYTATRKLSHTPIYTFNIKLPASAVTGNYTAVAKIGDAVFQKILKVETIIPNRLKIEWKTGNEPMEPGKKYDWKLVSTWLHGAPAANLKATAKIKYVPVKTKFNILRDFIFDDPIRSRAWRSEWSNVFNGKLGSKGEATVPVALGTSYKPSGFLKVVIEARVFEPSGAFSVDYKEIPIKPYRRYVGVKLPKNEWGCNSVRVGVKNKIEVAVLDRNGNYVKDPVKVKMALYKISWDWWWNSKRGDLARYVADDYLTLIKEKTISVENGKGFWELNIQSEGDYLLLAEDVESGHRSGAKLYIGYYGWWGGVRRGKTPQEASMLMFSVDKKDAKVGDTVHITVPSPAGARMLVTLENSNKILSSKWLPTAKGKTVYSFKVTPRMTPTVYVSVEVFQPRDRKNDLPIRMYGVVPVNVFDPDTVLKPVISTDDVLRPNKETHITVKEKHGKPMTYTLAVVDEGLLGLTSFRTPDPWKHFYPKLALGVRTWDIFSFVFGRYGTEIERLLAIGGDMEAADSIGGQREGKKTANRFPPVVMFMGPFKLGAGKTKTHTIKMPLYVGAVRVMVVAASGKAFGKASKTVTVKTPVMVLATLPRVLGTGESLELPVSVFAMNDNVRHVQVEAQVDGPVKIEGPSTKSVTFKSKGDKLVMFNLKTLNRKGVAYITVRAKGEEYTAVQKIEIDVRPPTFTVSKVVQNGSIGGDRKEIEIAAEPIGMPGTNDAVLEVYRMKPIQLEKRLRYLIHYPYGCIEQTTSSVFPQLYLSKFLDLDDETKVRIDRNITAGINRLRAFQTSSGGFSYWPGERNASSWGTNYAGHFLLEAARKGYKVPDDMITAWKNYQRSAADSWDGSSTSEQAYRLFTLALAKVPAVAAMNRLRERNNISSLAKWYLAGAYFLSGKRDVAYDIVKDLDPTAAISYNEASDSTFGSPLRDRAVALYVLSTIGDPRRGKVALNFAETVSKNNYMSTQTTAYVLMALANVTDSFTENDSIVFEYAVGNNNFEKVSFSKFMWKEKISVKDPIKVKIKANDTAFLYPQVVLFGKPAPGREEADSNGLTLEVKYYAENGDTIDPSAIEQGTDFNVEIKVANTSGFELKNVALTWMVPSGWEIRNPRVDPSVVSKGGSGEDSFTYRDYRDDRVYTYFDLGSRGSKTFLMHAHAAYKGRFYMPMVSVEAMYKQDIHARTKGRWVEVKDSEQGNVASNSENVE